MGYIPKTLPGFTYTGECSTELRADWGWIIRMKTSGTLTITDRRRKVDAFLVGGGGGGGNGTGSPEGGGGGGYTKTVSGISLSPGTGYWIEIGQGGAPNANGSASSAFGYQANVGNTSSGNTGGAGGSGGGAGQYTGTPGNGGSDGANGSDSAKGHKGGAGQGSTTREFGMSGWTLYAGGGGGAGGGSYQGNSSACGYGGSGGGGNGYNPSTGEAAQSGSANTGGGGGGAGGTGGSGIVCIRNSADDVLPVVFKGTWLTNLVHNGTDVERLIYNGTRLFMRAMRRRERKCRKHRACMWAGLRSAGC